MMFRLLLIFVFFAILINAENTNELSVETKDDLIEFYFNCSCIPYYECSTANRYMYAYRANRLPAEVICATPNFVCCKNVTDPDITKSTEPPEQLLRSTTTKTTIITPPLTTTVKSVSVKRIDSAAGLECGMAKTGINVRILTNEIDSAATIPGEIPWIVEIFEKTNNPRKPYELKCAGSLIHPKVVVTATHSVVSATAKSLKIIATGLNHFQEVGVRPGDERGVAKIIKHPKYYSGGLFNDIALLILKKKYSFSQQYLNSVCVPKPNQNFDGKICIAAGWGQNVSLHKVDLPVINSLECQNLLRRTRLGSVFNLHESFLCAGGVEGKDTCKRDGGGPLMCVEENQYVLAGIVSWGVDQRCGVADQPGAYANVAKYSDWITQELSKNGLKIKEN